MLVVILPFLCILLNIILVTKNSKRLKIGEQLPYYNIMALLGMVTILLITISVSIIMCIFKYLQSNRFVNDNTNHVYTLPPFGDGKGVGWHRYK